MYFQEKNILKNSSYHYTKRALYCLCKHKYYLLYSIFLRPKNEIEIEIHFYFKTLISLLMKK